MAVSSVAASFFVLLTWSVTKSIWEGLTFPTETAVNGIMVLNTFPCLSIPLFYKAEKKHFYTLRITCNQFAKQIDCLLNATTCTPSAKQILNAGNTRIIFSYDTLHYRYSLPAGQWTVSAAQNINTRSIRCKNSCYSELLIKNCFKHWSKGDTALKIKRHFHCRLIECLKNAPAVIVPLSAWQRKYHCEMHLL